LSVGILGEEAFSIVGIFVAAVFALAAVSKVWSFKKFTKTVAHYPVASRAPRLTASLLIVGEAIAALLLPFSGKAAGAAVPALVLLCLFSLTLLWFGMPHEGDCGCLGALPSARSSKQVVLRNAALALGVVYAALGPTIWPSAPLASGAAIILFIGALILWPAVQLDSGSADPGRRAALYKVAAIAAGIALLPVLRPRDALACACGNIISCGSCNHYSDSYYSGCCVNCTCSPPKKMVRRQWFKTCNVCCEGATEFYCYSTYPCVSC
jgi:hypothetical protein